jgi:hypothetical protein
LITFSCACALCIPIGASKVNTAAINCLRNMDMAISWLMRRAGVQSHRLTFIPRNATIMPVKK